MVPFTVEQFFAVFAAYNAAVWPLQLVLLALAVLAIALSFTRLRARRHVVAGILAALWLWMGLVYHVIFFAAINPLAPAFGVAFALEAVLLIRAAVGPRPLHFMPRRDAYGAAGAVLLLYALIVYPLLGYLLGHRYPAVPTFGAPCPTTIFTFGLLLWTVGRVPWWVLVIPGLWALLGLSAAVSLNVPQDLGLFAAGIVAIPLLTVRGRRGGALPVNLA
jgi:Family of unknown function (DUF6064)